MTEVRIGFVLFPGVTALDAVGPYEVLSRVPGARVFWLAGEVGAVAAQGGLGLEADTPFEECPPLNVICVPGGPGQAGAMDDPRLLAFLRQQAETADWITAVCTGSLVLGAAGLLRGYRATTHWRFRDCLADLGALPLDKRVVCDRNRVTAAGVSAGIDMALALVAKLADERTARAIQLGIEYDPAPPFDSGSAWTAEEDLKAEALRRVL
jgi:cyclohexyl-isocyanide hydratase